VWFLVSAAAAAADQIVVQGTSHVSVKLVGFEQGQVRFRTADGKLRSVWIDLIDLLIVERGDLYDDFNEAERFLAGGDPERAIVRYGRASRLSEEFWPDLITARLLMACDSAGRLDKATTSFLRVLRGRFSGPWAAARIIPKVIPAKHDTRVQRAIEQLNGALLPEPDESQRALIELLRYEILRRTNDEAVADARRRVAALSLPEAARSERAYGIQLGALRETLGDSVSASSLFALEGAIRDCPEAVLPGFLLLKGQVLLRTALARDEFIRAAWSLMRVAIHFPDNDAAPDALYGTAQALERIGRPDKAIDLLTECLQHVRLGQETRQQAEAAVSRLKEGQALER
jgi:tetratricopeptide (TPR) repeat protein